MSESLCAFPKGHVPGCLCDGCKEAHYELRRRAAAGDAEAAAGKYAGRLYDLLPDTGLSSATELEIRQNELYEAMRAVEEMPASEAQTACIVKLGARMRKLVELRGKSEVGRCLDV